MEHVSKKKHKIVFFRGVAAMAAVDDDRALSTTDLARSWESVPELRRRAHKLQLVTRLLFPLQFWHDSDTDYIKVPIGSSLFTLGDLHPGELHQPRHCGAERVGCHTRAEPPRNTGWCCHD